MPRTARPKLLLISLGGTWAMKERRRPDGKAELVAEPLGPSYRPVDDFPELEAFAEVEFCELMYVDSTDLIPADWTTVADAIVERRTQFDGFVVAMGTDTMEFAAAALSFALRGIGCPVVLTGAQIRKSACGSDARANVVNACQLAALSDNAEGSRLIHEVVVAFGSRIIRGTRCRKFSERDVDAFDTVNVPLLGSFGTSIRLNRDSLLSATKQFRAATAFDANVALLTLHPGLHPDAVRDVAARATGLVLAGFGAGNIPISKDASMRGRALDGIVRECIDQGKPVVVTTRCVVGETEVLYSGGRAAMDAGAITPNDMTPECAFVKLAWLLANEHVWIRAAHRAADGGPGRLGAVRHMMMKPVAGELLDNTTMKRNNFKRHST